MFENIGSKIKSVSEITCWIGIIGSVILGFIVMVSGTGEGFLIGLLIMILGALFSWLGSLLSYGFGQLIENTDQLVRDQNKATATKMTTSAPTTNQPQPLESIEFSESMSKMDKIKQLNRLKEKGLITETDYKKKMEEIL